MKRSRLRQSRGTIWPKDVSDAIYARDRGRCVCALAGFPLEVIARCPGYPTERDHVRAGGMGLKSRSTVDNGVLLSPSCHRWKTEHGREARPLLLAYLSAVAV